MERERKLSGTLGQELGRDRSVLRVKEAAVRLGLSEGAIYQHVRRGNLPSLRLGRVVLIPRDALPR